MIKFIHLDEVDSTNSYMKRALQNDEFGEGTVVVADFQTGGRGQRGNGWESKKAENLTFSILLNPDFVSANKQFIISQIVALAIKDILDEYVSGISIKWPNDIYWNNKKICGILIENSLVGDKITQSIVGIGININQTEFESDAPNPISLKQIIGKIHNISDLLIEIIERIQFYYNQIKLGNSDKIISAYKASLFRNDGFYKYSDEVEIFDALIVDVEPSGLLVLRTTEGEIRKFAFKEVQYIIE